MATENGTGSETERSRTATETSKWTTANLLRYGVLKFDVWAPLPLELKQDWLQTVLAVLLFQGSIQ